MVNNSKIIYNCSFDIKDSFEVDYYDYRGPRILTIKKFEDFSTTTGISKKNYLIIKRAGWKPQELESGIVVWHYNDVLRFFDEFWETFVETQDLGIEEEGAFEIE